MIPIVILCGGLATRLYPLTKQIPKSMLDVNGKPFIHYQLDLLKKKGVSKIIICAGFLGDQIKSYVKDGKDFGLDVVYSFEDENKLLGTGGAIKKALPLLESSFGIIYGDSFLDINYSEVIDFFQSSEKQGLMTVLENNNRWDKSNIVFKNSKIINYDKKYRTACMKYIDYGFSLLKKEVFDTFEKETKFDLTCVYKNLLKQQELAGYEIKNRFYEIGSKQGLEELKNILSRR